ncbi:MAG: DNA translocase FtsK [Verrucomicrobia bacterium]|nr:DNA translocase FtsK [Verrucomicrobiota bacterium]
MARKDTNESANSRQPHGFHDVIGILLLGLAALLSVALLSYDAHDVPQNALPTNSPVHNWIGPFGAGMAYRCFVSVGFGAYLVPPLLALLGVGCFWERLAFLRRRWLWVLALFLCCLGLLDLFKANLVHPGRSVGAEAGGIIGGALNDFLFRSWFGTPGAAILYAMLYLISLLFLTNFQLGRWIRTLTSKAEETEGSADLSPEEKELEKRAKALEKQARDLQEQIEKSGRAGKDEKPSGLGADLQPVPEPTVRDLSIPQPRPKGGKGKPGEAAPAETPATAQPLSTGSETKDPREIGKATTADILGKKADAASKSKPGQGDEPAAVEKTPASAQVTEKTSDAAKPGELAPKPDSAAVPVPTPQPPKPRIILGPPKAKPLAVASAPKIGNYQLPTLDFLQMPDTTVKPTETKEELMANAQLMKNTLAQFDIEVAIGDITKGPTITRYELHPAPGVKLERITNLTNNIAAALKAERIHVLAPVPGKSSVGVEVPNSIKTKVILRDVLEAEEWHKTKSRIPLALGKDVYGHPIVADLAEMPHLLIAGSTGSGKSVCINCIIASLLYRFPPDQLRFVMIDPKVVELQQYNALPHLVVPVVTDPKKVILALRWVVNEMEKRYQIFAKVGVRNIKSFNERPRGKPAQPKQELELPLTAKREKVEINSDGFAVELDEDIVIPREEDIVIPEKLSYIVVIIDELADLMLVAPADVEMAIARITQMARAAGIHCIVATQRPSVDVITGVIKANIPARIAFQVASRVDSRTILDAMGADKLLGKGDMLYLPPGSAKLHRAQGALVTDQEIQSLVDFIAKQGKPSYELDIHQQLSKPTSDFNAEEGSGEDEELIEQCIEVIRSEQKASVSLLQRRLRLGYTRAARIMDELENRGIVGPSKGAEPRDILIDLDGGGADGDGREQPGTMSQVTAPPEPGA